MHNMTASHITPLAAHLLHTTHQLIHTLGMLDYTHVAAQLCPATTGAVFLSIFSIIRRGRLSGRIVLASILAIVLGVLCDRAGMCVYRAHYSHKQLSSQPI